MLYLKDLILTELFLLKGHINTGDHRLSSFLNGIPKRFLEMHEVTATDVVHGVRSMHPRILLRIEEIIFAHELAETGDESLRELAEREKDEVTVTARFSGATPWILSGRVSRRAIERDTSGQHEFVVFVEPKFEGLSSTGQNAFKDLPYVIANRRRIALICE